jgi:lipopolysaccharide export system protein LptA
MRYNTQTKVADFYTKTYIWTTEGEIITANKGRYNTQDSTYFFHDNAYILTDFRETWADTIDFNAKRNDAILYGNIQIDDNEHSSSAFGDYGQYWGERGETELTKRPSLLNYDGEQGNADTVYMRADTIFMYVIYPSDKPRTETADSVSDPLAHLRRFDSLPDSVRISIADSLRSVISGLRHTTDSLRRTSDSIMEVLYPTPLPVVPPAYTPDSLLYVRDTLSVPDSLAQTILPPPLLDNPSVLDDTLPQLIDTLPEVMFSDTIPSLIDSLPVADSLSTPETPEIFEVPENPAPPEVVEMRGKASEITVRIDSLQQAESYIRPKVEESPEDVAVRDSLARFTADSLARVDSLAFVDSLFKFHPKEYKKLEKTEAKRIKEELKAAKKAEKLRLREEKRAAKEAERAAKLAARRKRVWSIEDSLRMTDSLRTTDSLRMVDSLRIADSLLLTSLDSLPAEPESEQDTTERIWRGWYNVKVWRKDVQVVCDSIVGFSRDSTVRLYTEPVLWNQGSQIVSDSLTIFTGNGNIERVEFFGDPIMSSEVAPKQYNQVTGKSMISLFRDGEVYRHNVLENAQALYYAMEEGYTDPVTFIVLTAGNISFVMEDETVRYIIPRENVSWPVYPIDKIPTDQSGELKGFEWYSNRQPVLEDVFDRRIRPAERAFYDSLPLPAFPVAARIDRRREYLISNRMWADRTDPLPAYAVDYVNSLSR